MLDSMLVASEEATRGSVIAKQDRISPASSGLSQRSFNSGEPYRSSTSMLHVSGAEQLNTSGPTGERPMISKSGTYSRFVSPAPCPLVGRNRFHKPAALDLGLNFSMTGTGFQLLGHWQC